LSSALALFPDALDRAIPETEGIKYAGSKRKLIPYILRAIDKLKPQSVFDAFAGTTRVSQALAASGYRVYANDIAPWSRVFATCYLMNPYPSGHFGELIDHLNALPGEDGWFTENYGGEATTKSASRRSDSKRPWQRHNTLRLDAIRNEIERLNLNEVEKCVALTSLILALDKVDSTLGHFASYLREWSPRSYDTMTLRIPRLLPRTAEHVVYQDDIFKVLDTVTADVAYIDPPYGSNNDKMPPSRVRYQAYYHLWASICLFDKPELFGKVRRRADSSDVVGASVFEEFRKSASGRFLALEAIERTLQTVRAKHIVLSYSSGGRATATELDELIRRVGTLLEIVEIDHKRHVMAGMRWTGEWIKDNEDPHREFLFVIAK
jgi:adenine-specific DNA-methyltransferase